MFNSTEPIKINPNSNEEAQAFLRIDVMSKDADKVGRLFNAKIVELALANFPGWTGRSGVVPSRTIHRILASFSR